MTVVQVEDRTDVDRVRALVDLGLWGSAPEERFDRITRAAQQLFDVGSAMLTLVAHDRLWLKSAQGMTWPQGMAGSGPRSGSFCDHTVRDDATMVVPDATVDPRFAAQPFVVGAPHVRFYAGHPLEVGGGHRVGTLCVLDPRPRQFSPRERRQLEVLAAWAQQELLGATEQDRAAEIQRGLQPHAGPIVELGHDLAGACFASRAVGGDLLDWQAHPDGDLDVTLGDVMGKGMGAAIVMATVRATMRAAGRLGGPAAALRNAAESLDDDLQSTGTIVTLCQIRITPSTGEVLVGDAGHGLCLIIRADGGHERLPAGGLPLGVLADEVWPERRVRLDIGDTLVVFSDGLLEMYDDDIDRTVGEVLRISWASPDTRGIVDHFASLARGSVLTDDVTIAAFRRTATGGSAA